MRCREYPYSDTFPYIYILYGCEVLCYNINYMYIGYLYTRVCWRYNYNIHFTNVVTSLKSIIIIVNIYVAR